MVSNLKLSQRKTGLPGRQDEIRRRGKFESVIHRDAINPGGDGFTQALKLRHSAKSIHAVVTVHCVTASHALGGPRCCRKGALHLRLHALQANPKRSEKL